MLDLKEYGIVMWPERKIVSFRKKLLTWYDENKRDLIKNYNPPLNLDDNDNPCDKDFRKEVSRRRKIIDELGNH